MKHGSELINLTVSFLERATYPSSLLLAFLNKKVFTMNDRMKLFLVFKFHVEIFKRIIANIIELRYAT